jgi:AmmeMemoRadiSam system protein B
MTDISMDQENRQPAVAGAFYPDDPHRVSKAVDSWMTTDRPAPKPWRAALVPHAGWVYSGRIAADVLARISFPSAVIVLCPKHHPGGACCAVAPWRRWWVPGGSIDAHLELGHQLARDVPGLELDDWPHRAEHAIEVQLPFIARVAPQSRIVAITVGRVDLQECHRLAEGIADVTRGQLDSLLFLISSDMNHFANDKENRRLDELALQALDQLDPDLLYRTCHEHRISMCGMLPAVIVLSTLRRLDALHRAVRVAYATSAEVSGDARQVVGYAGVLFD